MEALPLLHHLGQSAQVGPEVLLSSVAEAGAAKGARACSGAQKPRRHGVSPRLANDAGNPRSVAEQIRAALYQKDHLETPRVHRCPLLGADALAQRELGGVPAIGSSATPTWLLDDPLEDPLAVASASTVGSFSRASRPRGPPSAATMLMELRTQGQTSVKGISAGPSQMSGCSSYSGVPSSRGAATSARSLNRAPSSESCGGGSASSPTRTRDLQASFNKTRAEIQARLKQIDENLRGGPVTQTMLHSLPSVLTFPKGRGSMASPMSTGRSEAGYRPNTRASGISVAGGRRDSVGEGKTDTEEQGDGPNFKPLFEAARLAQLHKVVPRPGHAAVGATTKEELLYACDYLNFVRWLCGLQPVSLEKNCITASDFLNQALLARPEVHAKPNNQQFLHLCNYARQLADFMGHPGRCIILHKETSLTNSVGQCLLSTQCIRRPKPWGPGIIADIQRCAAGHRAVQGPPPTFTQQILRLLWERPRLTLGTLPPALLGFQTVWALTDEEAPEASPELGPSPVPSIASAPKGAAKALLLPEAPRTPPSTASTSARGARPRSQNSAAFPKPASRSGRGSERARTRVRKIEWGVDAPLLEQDKARACVLVWGDRAGAVSFRRLLLNPALKNFGASRMQDTCVLWTGEDPLSRHPWGGATTDGVDFAPESWPSMLSTQALDMTNFPQGSADAEDIVCFPPPGIFPRELLFGHVPFWSIMPDTRIFQPTQHMKVRMWRVKISGGQDGMPLSADRLMEVPLQMLSCDCSSKGSPFCILFRPSLEYIDDGEQLEVELSGLRGMDSRRRYFFHEFSCFRAPRMDRSLLQAAEALRNLLDNPGLWGSPSAIVGGAASSSWSPGFDGAASTPRLARTLLSRPVPALPTEEAPGHVEIGLVSHPSCTVITDSVDVAISLWCPEAVAIRGHLCTARVSSTEEVARSTLVLKVRDYFLVRVKLPMAPCRYELSFFVASKRNPDVMLEHPLRYCIMSSDVCPNLLISLEHPLQEKFGYALHFPAAQALGVSILAPPEYRVRSGYVYFLVHVDPEASGCGPAGEAAGEIASIAAQAAAATALSAQRPTGGSELIRTRNTVLFQERQAEGAAMTAKSSRVDSPEASPAGTAGGGQNRPGTGKQRTGIKDPLKDSGPLDKTLKDSGALDKTDRGGTAKKLTKRQKDATEERTMGVVSMLFKALAEKLEGSVQDSRESAHVDISLVEANGRVRYVLRLQQRADLPEIHDGLLLFTDQDVGSKVEVHISFPCVEGCPPMKLAEWLVIKREETFPAGF